MNQTKTTSEKAAGYIDDAIDTVRWCRQHLQDRDVSLRLRELQITLAAVALALQQEMDGETGRARDALIHAAWGYEFDNGEPPAYSC